MKRFAQLLEQHVQEAGIKQKHLAASAHISYNYLLRLLAGNRRPSKQVVNGLAEVLHLAPAQTGELLAAAGYAPPMLLLQSEQGEKVADVAQPAVLREGQLDSQLVQQLYRLMQEIPESQQKSFFEEMKHLLGYARYKYIFSDGVSLLNLELPVAGLENTGGARQHAQNGPPYLDLIAQFVGELHETAEYDEVTANEGATPPSPVIEDILSAIDRLTGNILAGEIAVDAYQTQLIVQAFDVLREGAPWEIRRRIAEALPGICRLDMAGAEQLMETLRMDMDDVRGADIRRRVVEALADLFEASPASLPGVVRLLRPQPGDDIYVALATIEASSDLQVKIKQILEKHLVDEEVSTIMAQNVPETARIQRQLLSNWEGVESEVLQFSLTLHNLLRAPDTLLISLEEGLQSPEKLMKYVAARYLERLLPIRPLEALTLYQTLLQATTGRNVRRTVAKALPALLQCLKEASLVVRTQARAVIVELANDPDVYIRRAVADHAMHIAHIDREFLLVILRSLHKDTDQAIRHRLQPVALDLAQVWLTWYAETAGLVEPKRSRSKSIAPFGK